MDLTEWFRHHRLSRPRLHARARLFRTEHSFKWSFLFKDIEKDRHIILKSRRHDPFFHPADESVLTSVDEPLLTGYSFFSRPAATQPPRDCHHIYASKLQPVTSTILLSRMLGSQPPFLYQQGSYQLDGESFFIDLLLLMICDRSSFDPERLNESLHVPFVLSWTPKASRTSFYLHLLWIGHEDPYICIGGYTQKR